LVAGSAAGLAAGFLATVMRVLGMLGGGGWRHAHAALGSGHECSFLQRRDVRREGLRVSSGQVRVNSC
jgi:hypothetical protein